ncbi:MAG: DUF6132 family protein [Prolixibacteraceae bacterium]
MKKFLLKHKWQVLGVVVGAIGGYLYWYYIGCTSGTCPIQSNWHTSSLYGAVMGFLVSDIRKKTPKKEEVN